MNFKDKIQIYDNFLPQKIFEEIQVHLVKPNWAINRSYPKSRKVFWGMELTDEPFFNKTIFSFVKKKLDKRYKIKKILANAQSYGQDGSPHVDTESANSKTFVIYVNEEWDFLWGGETVFFDRYITDKKIHVDSEEMMSVLPVPNKAILFPSNMYHYGTSPSREFYGLRYTVAYQLI